MKPRPASRALVPALLGLALAPLLLALGAPPAGEVHLVVLHTNDMHGQVVPLPATWVKDQDPPPTSGGLARVGAYLRKVRREVKAEGGAVLVLDAGDWYQGTPEGGLDKGLGILRALAMMGYDALAVGNHEFDHGVEHFEGMLAEAPLPALLANARTKSGATLPGTGEYQVFERAGLSIGVVGMCSDQTPQMSHPTTRDLEWESAPDCLTRIKAAATARPDAPRVDFWIPVTHCGVDADRELAQEHPDLDLIVGGHTHTVLHNGVREGRTLIVQAGSKARSVGRVDLWFDAETRELVRGEAKLVNLYADYEAPDRLDALEEHCAELQRRSAEAMDLVVGHLAEELDRDGGSSRSSAAGNFITDLMRSRTGADVAIHNRGGIRAALDAGPVTRRDLFRILPFDNHLETLTMTGQQLSDLMERSIEGQGRSGLEFSGLVARVRRGGKFPEVVQFLVGGTPLDPEGTYRVTTNNFLASGGDAYKEFMLASERVTDPILQRDLLEEHFRAQGDEPVRPPRDNRFVLVD